MKYLGTNTTGELGVIEVNKIVRLNNSIFHVVQHENDIGIDGLIEFVVDEEPTNKMVAVQIKTGKSYFLKNGDCVIPIDGHYDYWRNYPLPVIGIVCRVSRRTGEAEAYWIDISNYLQKHSQEIQSDELKTIKFPSRELYKFDNNSFKKILLPYVLNEVPDISYDEAKGLFLSKHTDEFYIGLQVLFKRYTHIPEVWDKFISIFKEWNVRTIPNYLVYALSHIPWHPDLYEKGTLTEETQQYVKERIREFTQDDIIKLLYFIDENDISRGTVGQCVEAIISVIEKHDEYLKNIILDDKLPMVLRERAGVIYAYYNKRKSLDTLGSVQGSHVIDLVVSHIKEFGCIDLY